MKRVTLRNLVRGNTRKIRLRLREARTPDVPAGQEMPPLDLTGATVRMSMRRAPEDGKDEDLQELVLTKTTDNANDGVVLDQTIDDTKGKLEFYLKPEDTKYVRPGLLNFDVELETGAGEVYTVLGGQIYLDADITTVP